MSENLIKIGYKLCEQDIRTGKLYPLFIGKSESFPINKWLIAKNIQDHKGFAHRPGFHIGEIPDAPWLKSADGTYKSQRGKNFKRVWVQVEYTGENITDMLKKLGLKQLNYIQENAYYNFKESGDRNWIISDSMYIQTIISEPIRQCILRSLNYDEDKAFEPYAKRFKNRKNKVLGGN